MKKQTDPYISTEDALNALDIKKDMPIIRTDLTQAEWNDLADSKLLELLQTTSGELLLRVIKESKDRILGKPIQQVNANISQRNVTIQIGVIPSLLVDSDKPQLLTIEQNQIDNESNNFP